MLARSTFAAFASATAVILAGCGGGDSGDGGQSTSDGADHTVSGRVADGYLRDATVCLDLDADKSCDDDEPSTRSQRGGAYELDIGSREPGRHPIIVEVPAHAIDEDEATEAAVGDPYVMSAPAGEGEFVSPLTTVIDAQLESTPGLDPSDLSQALAVELGVDEANMLADYVAKGESDERYQRAHRIARVFAALLAENESVIEDMASDQGMDPARHRDALHRMMVRHVIDHFGPAVARVEANGDTGAFDPDAIAKEIGPIPNDEFERRFEREQFLAAQQPIDEGKMRALFEDGVYEFQDEGGGDYEQMLMRLQAPGSTTMLHQVAAYTNESWGDIEEEHPIGEVDIRWDHDAGEWTHLVVEHEDDQRHELRFSDGAVRGPWGQSILFKGAAVVDLQGRDIADVLERTAFHYEDDAISGQFGQNAEAILFGIIQDRDVYGIDYDEGDCPESTGNCEIVRNEEGDPLTGFEGLLQPTGTTWQAIETGNTDNTIYLTLQGHTGDRTGTAVFDRTNENETYQSEWFIRNLGSDTEVILVDKPRALRAHLGTSDAQYKLFAKHDGYLREGDYIPAGTLGFESAIWFYNEQAIRDVFDNHSQVNGTGPFIEG